MSVPSESPGTSARHRATVADRVVTWLLGWPATLAFAVGCVAMLGLWAINYVYWPMFVDGDHVAMIARDWDMGFLPYRDRFTFQFPGEIYLYWAIGKVVGWSNTVGYYAADVAFVAGFGVWLVIWSRRALGWVLPGLIGFAAFLGHYLTYDYSLTMQRDWHTAFYCVLALSTPQVWRGRGGRVASAVLMGWTLVNRPQAILAFPALAIVIDLSARGPLESWTTTLKAYLAYGVCMTIAFALWFAPVVMAGQLDNFLAIFKQLGPESPYIRHGKLHRLVEPYPNPIFDYAKIAFHLLFCIFALRAVSREVRLLTVSYALALVGFAFYGPLSPMPLPYHKLPLVVLWTFNLAMLSHIVLKFFPIAGPLKLLALLLLAIIAVPGKPRYVSPGMARLTIAAIRAGERPPVPFEPYLGTGADYPFRDYWDTIDYIKKNSNSKTKVTNMTHKIYEAFHVSTGLPSAVFSDAHGLYYFPAIEAREVKELEDVDDAIVIWDPSYQPFMTDHPLLVRAIQANYSREARFGKIEVWKRKPKP